MMMIMTTAWMKMEIFLKSSRDDSEYENEVKEALGKEDSSKKRKRMINLKSKKNTKS